MRTGLMKHGICLISRFACQVHAKPAKCFFVYGGKDDRGMYFTAFELRKLAERQSCGLIGGCADGQCDQYFVRMEPWVAAAKIAGF